MAYRYLFAAVIVVLAGCATSPDEPQTVKVPVEVEKPVPVMPAAAEPLLMELPRLGAIFTGPNDPKALSCLTPDYEDVLREHLIVLRGRIRAWERWYRENRQADNGDQSVQ